MRSPTLVLYELAGANPELRFSPHCWKTRMALAHKGLQAKRIPWRFTEKDRIAFSGQGQVPVLVDDGEVVCDSWRIALHLEGRFASLPSLFGDPAAVPLAHFVNHWADQILLPEIARNILLDIFEQLDAKDRRYFRESREKRFGDRLENVVAAAAARPDTLTRILVPLRRLLADHAFVGGAAASYADYCVFGMFMWARCVGAAEFLAADDPVYLWRERLLDAFGGLARSAPVADSGPAP